MDKDAGRAPKSGTVDVQAARFNRMVELFRRSPRTGPETRSAGGGALQENEQGFGGGER